YLAYALTPEVQSDAVTYHLSLATSAKRDGGFPSRIGFYEVLPQGIETLFAMAYRFGGEPAAKLVHLSFLFLTVPLAAVIAESLSLQASLGWMAGLMYAFSPVVGVSSTAAYNDAAITFYVLAVFALLLQWWKNPARELLLP